MVNCAVHYTAHGTDATGPGKWFVRMKRGADDRSDTVGADQEIATGRFACRCAHRDAAAANREAADLGTQCQRFHADPLKQCAVKGRTKCHDCPATKHLRIWKLGTLDDCAIHPAQFAPRRGESPSEHDVGHAERPQRGDGIRCDEEPNPSSRGDVARSKILIRQPALRKAMPADSPPMPAPTIKAERTY
jgi:hypothetical protein